MSKQFPVLYHKKKYTDPDRRRTVPWAMLAPFEENAQSFHGQSLQRLSERGGLGPGEMIAIIRNDKSWWKIDEEEVSWSILEGLVKEHEGPQPATEIEFLRWFYLFIKSSSFVTELSDPTCKGVMDQVFERFVRETKKKLPPGY